MPELNFGQALELLQNGKRVARRAWKNVNYVFLVAGSTFSVNRAPLNQFFPEGTEVSYAPHLDAHYADGRIGVWTISNGDALADDWFEVTE